jgi:hypothetical protein
VVRSRDDVKWLAHAVFRWHGQSVIERVRCPRLSVSPHAGFLAETTALRTFSTSSAVRQVTATPKALSVTSWLHDSGRYRHMAPRCRRRNEPRSSDTEH